MTIEELTHNINPILYGWIVNTLGRRLEVVYDLKKVKHLTDKNYPRSEFTEEGLNRKLGVWNTLGELSNLQTLEFPKTIQQIEIADFSFLPKLKKLQKLSLSYTNFTDCTLLSQLSELKYLSLPSRKTLEHAEVLKTFAFKVVTNEPFYSEDTFPKYETISIGNIPAVSDESIAIRFLTFGLGEYVDDAITKDVVDELCMLIRSGKGQTVCLSTDEYGEESVFTVDFKHCWAALAFNTYDENGNCIWYQSLNPDSKSMDDAPVDIGGQSPVPKMLALEDMDLVADSVSYFIRTGKLYPGVSWAKFS